MTTSLRVILTGPYGRWYPKGFAWAYFERPDGVYRWATAVYRHSPRRYTRMFPSSPAWVIHPPVHIGCRVRPGASSPSVYWPCVMAGRPLLCGPNGFGVLPYVLDRLHSGT